MKGDEEKEHIFVLPTVFFQWPGCSLQEKLERMQNELKKLQEISQ
jgi:hypothetical protein